MTTQTISQKSVKSVSLPLNILQSNLYLAVTLGEWLSDRLIHVDCLIQVVQNTDQNNVKMPLYITVNDVVYSLCIKALKNSLTRLKVNATITWLEKNGA